MFNFDGKDGTFNSSGSIQFTNTVGELIVKEYSSFTLNSGHTLTIQNPARALVITSQGNITINGTINLDYKGGYGDRYLEVQGVEYDLLGGLGGDGGNGGSGSTGGKTDLGTRGAGGLRGGGGGGGGRNGGMAGGKNSLFSQNGVAAGPCSQWCGESKTCRSPDTSTFGAGQGGDGTNVLCGTGSLAEGGWAANTSNGRPAGGGGGQVYARNATQYSNNYGGDAPTNAAWNYLGGGGVLVLLARGDIIINSTASILARGHQGGNGGVGVQVNWDASGGGGGGGSGGGRIVIIRLGSYSNTGTVTLTGGAGGIGGQGASNAGLNPKGDNGLTGETGTLSSYQVSTLGPPDPTTLRAKATSLNRATMLTTFNKIYSFDGANGILNSDFSFQFANSWGETIIRSYQNFTLNTGHTLSLLRPARALIILSQNDIIINGRIDLDNRGGLGDRYLEVNGVNYDLLGGLGGNGGNGGGSTNNGGIIDTYYRCAGGMRGGGGGGGGPSGGRGSFKNTDFDMIRSNVLGEDVTVGTSKLYAEDGYNGLGGGGGTSINYSITGARLRGGPSIANTFNKGAAHGGGGHIGVNTANSSFSGLAPEAFARPADATGGGVLVLIALGSITINGEVWARGSGGGRGGHAYTGTDNYQSYGGGGGGGSGGGKILALYQTSFINNGSILLTGGAGGLSGNGDGGIGAAGSAGTSGDTGSISSFQVDLSSGTPEPQLNIYLGSQIINSIYLGINKLIRG